MNETVRAVAARSTDVGAMMAGLFFVVVGVAFVLEASDVWTFQLSNLRLLAPLGLLMVGIGLLISASTKNSVRPQDVPAGPDSETEH